MLNNKLFSSNVRSEFNAFLTFFFDIVVTMFVLVGLLSFIGYPLLFIIENIVPALAVGVLVGNVIYIRMAIALSKQTGIMKTALPLGIDITSVVAIIFLVIAPSLQLFKLKFDDLDTALRYSWYVGMGASLWLGIIKFALAFCSETMRRFIPIAGTLGSIAGVAFVWLGANPVLSAFELPIVGFLSLIICLVSLMAHVKLPGGLPGTLAAMIVCIPLYYLVESWGFIPEHQRIILGSNEILGLHIPILQLGSLQHLFGNTLGYLAIIAPLAILVSVIATNIVAAAKHSGNDYSSRNVLLTDAAATFVLGLFGGIGQTTPYLGIETYKRMGAGHVYVILTIIAMLIVCLSGLLNLMLSYIPATIFFPLLVIVSIDIVSLAFASSRQSNHSPAIVVAMVPAVMNLLYIKIDEIMTTLHFGMLSVQNKIDTAMAGGLPDTLKFGLHTLLSSEWYNSYYALRVLSQGYILTAILWGSTVALMMDKRLREASLFLIIGGLLSLFGIVHSVAPSGAMYFPWQLPTHIGERLLSMPYEIAAAYLISAILLYGLSFQKQQSN